MRVEAVEDELVAMDRGMVLTGRPPDSWDSHQMSEVEKEAILTIRQMVEMA